MGMYDSLALFNREMCVYCRGLVTAWSSADGIFLEERWGIGLAVWIIVPTVLNDICCEIDCEDIVIVEEGDGFEVDLLVSSEDGGMKIEGASPSFPVVPEGMYFCRLWAEKLFIYLRSQLLRQRE